MGLSVKICLIENALNLSVLNWQITQNLKCPWKANSATDVSYMTRWGWEKIYQWWTVNWKTQGWQYATQKVFPSKKKILPQTCIHTRAPHSELVHVYASLWWLLTLLNSGSMVPYKGIGFGPGIPRDSQYPKFHVKYLWN